MLGELDHVGYLTRNLEDSVAEVVERLGVSVVRRFERPRFALLGVYLGPGEGNIELFTFTEPKLLEDRLRGVAAEGSAMLLDHVAYAVADIEASAAALRAAGVSFCGPDQREELPGPVDLGGVRHLWTVPRTSAGASIQLLQR